MEMRKKLANRDEEGKKIVERLLKQRRAKTIEIIIRPILYAWETINRTN